MRWNFSPLYVLHPAERLRPIRTTVPCESIAIANKHTKMAPTKTSCSRRRWDNEQAWHRRFSPFFSWFLCWSRVRAEAVLISFFPALTHAVPKFKQVGVVFVQEPISAGDVVHKPLLGYPRAFRHVFNEEGAGQIKSTHHAQHLRVIVLGYVFGFWLAIVRTLHFNKVARRCDTIDAAAKVRKLRVKKGHQTKGDTTWPVRFSNSSRSPSYFLRAASRRSRKLRLLAHACVMLDQVARLVRVHIQSRRYRRRSKHVPSPLQPRRSSARTHAFCPRRTAGLRAV